MQKNPRKYHFEHTALFAAGGYLILLHSWISPSAQTRCSDGSSFTAYLRIKKVAVNLVDHIVSI